MTRTPLAGLGGSLLPSAFLAQLPAMGAMSSLERDRAERARRDLRGWWRGVESRCGPSTGLRTIVDDAALPLFGTLGYRSRAVEFERDHAHVIVHGVDGMPVAAIVRPWASRRTEAWRDIVRAARRAGATWAFVWAPPFLSVVDTSPSASRRALECVFPDVLEAEPFARLWSLCSASSVTNLAAVVARSHRFQESVRVDLQRGVVTALRAFERVVPHARGRVDAAPFDQALTLVYRLLFLLFAEARDLVPVRHPTYGRSYAIGALSRAAVEERSPVGLWEGLAATSRLSRAGCRTDDLIVRPFNGRLFARAAAPALERRRAHRRAIATPSREDAATREALTAIATRASDAGRVEISYADLGVEQLGAVYERLLDLDAEPARGRAHSARRKESGTFYTPQPLAEFLVRRTLAPLVAGATADAILALRVVDPAMGSGACLVAGCRFLARAYRRALVDEGRCADAEFDADERARIRRLIADRCLVGVDANPVAVQLARLSLWLTTLSRGRPLSFLDHRLRVGNSLLGAAPEDLARVDRATHTRDAPLPLFDAAGLETTMQTIAPPLFELSTRAGETVRDVHAKESIWARLISDTSPLEPWRRACDLWCARWFWRSGPAPAARELREALAAILGRSSSLTPATVREWTAAARAIGGAHGFFHWPLEFGDVFYDPSGHPRDRPGFDAVIGNPPWEMLRRDPRSGADQSRDGSRLVAFIRESGLYPSCDRGHVNLYQPFLERALSLARPGGQVGLILPWGVCTDDGATELRRRLFERSRVSTIVGLDNARGLFPIHRGLRFAVVVASPGSATDDMRLRLGVRTTDEIAALPDVDDPNQSSYPVRLSPGDLSTMSGPALRVPDARRGGDLDLLRRLTREFRPAGDSATWALSFGRELNASEDRDAFGSEGLPVVEGKHLSPFAVDVRGVDRRVPAQEARRRLPDRRYDSPRLGYRDVSGVGNKLALIAAIVPAGVVTTHTVFCLRSPIEIARQHFLCACFNSYVLNAVVRMLMGGHVTTSLVEQLPLPAWRGDAGDRRIARLSARMALEPRAPRAHARLQQAVARRYGVTRDEFAQILDGFPLVDEGDRRLALEGFAL